MKPIIVVRGPAPKWVCDIIAEEFTRNLGPDFPPYPDPLEIGGEIHTSYERGFALGQALGRVIRDAAFRAAAPKGPFLWLTHGGDLISPRNMATPHLYYALRMIFNHSVPKEFRTPESLHSVKSYSDVPKWSRSYRKAAIDALSAELRTRNPTAGLTPAMQDGLRWMAMAARAILNEGI